MVRNMTSTPQCTADGSLTNKRRSARLAMAKQTTLRPEEHIMSEEDDMDEIPLSKRLEMLQEVQQVQEGGLVDGRVNTYCNVNEVVKQIRKMLTSSELNQFRASPLGVILDVLECPRISGQLLIFLVGNCLRDTNVGTKEKLLFRILDHDVILSKEQFHLITGLKMGGLRGSMDNTVIGRFASRYFPGRKSVKRRDIASAFMNFKRNIPIVLPNDALKMSLIYALAHVFLGNQPSVNLPMSYLNLVDDIDEFNSYPWGDDVWNELVDHVYRCASFIEKGGSTRPTFGGYTFALQTWAFETFPTLAKAGMCELVPERVDSIPRCLRWKVCGRFNSTQVFDALIKDGKIVCNAVEPTLAEMMVGSVKELFPSKSTQPSGGKKKMSLSAIRRVQSSKDMGPKMTDASGSKHNAESTSKHAVVPDLRRMENESEKVHREVDLRGRKKRTVRDKSCGHSSLLKEITEIRAKQALQDKKLDDILEFIQQKCVAVADQKNEGKDFKMGLNVEEDVGNDGLNVGRKTDYGVDLENDMDMINDACGPSFDLLTPMPKSVSVVSSAAINVVRNETVSGECHVVEFGKTLDIPFTDTQYDPKDLELIDKEAELHFNSLKNADAVPPVVEKGIVGQAADVETDKMNDVGEDFERDEGKCELTNDVQLVTEVKVVGVGSTGSNEHATDVSGRLVTQENDSVDEAFGRFFVNSKVASGAGSGSVMQDSIVVFKGEDHPSKIACAEVERPKRVLRNPVRYTPTEVEPDNKRRKIDGLERAKNRLTQERGMILHGPFSEDPALMPAYEEIEKVRAFVNEGLLKRQGRGNKTCRYISKAENLTKNPIRLDDFKVENKTWLYELITPTEWLHSTHIEIAMHFLEVKGREYNHLQAYTTTSPFFLQGLYNHQDLVNVCKAKKEDVVRNRNLASEVKGSARKYARPWAECDFVYMPLNTGGHWVLLVLEVEGRTIRVYNSKGTKGKISRELRPYIPCVTELLPTLLDEMNVYDEHSGGPMGKQKFRIENVDGCPQQSDGCNCGMFMLKFAEYLMMDRDVSEVQGCDMELYRLKMATELMVYSNERSMMVVEK